MTNALSARLFTRILVEHHVTSCSRTVYNYLILILPFILLRWMQSLFSIGYKKIIEQEDLFDVCPNDSSGELCDKLER